MAQIFHPGFNTIAKVGLALAFAAPLLIIGAASAVSRSSYNTKVGVPLDQPVPFSHEHHVNELGINCVYCHSYVEKAAHSNLPATEVCMSCHSQIWTNSPLLEPVRESYKTNTAIKWNQLNKVPEFVYFNHSIHVNRGLNCNICHGPVQEMQLAYKGKTFHMAWCLNCHRNPENYVAPRSQVLGLYEKGQRTASSGYAGSSISPEERALLRGQDYHRTPEELEEGRKLVKQYGIKTKQLSDCSICHR